MENPDKDILFQAAEAWMELTQYRYLFTYGYKKKLNTITLVFTPSDFHHAAGFQYMKDISALRYSPGKLLLKILDGTIDTASFLCAAQFENCVLPRLHAILRLKASLDSEFTLFKFTPQYGHLYTNIKADYLISSHVDHTDFIFIIKSDSNSVSTEYTCCSIFEEGSRNFEEKQSPRTLLKKERIHIASNQTDILYNRLAATSEE